MDVEMMFVFALWQKIIQAELIWLNDLSGAEVSLSTDEQKIFIQNSTPFVHKGKSWPEVDEMRKNVDALYIHTSMHWGDPNRVRYGYRIAADLLRRSTTQALADLGVIFIDTVLIGPAARAAVLLSAYPRLYGLAKERAEYIQDESDLWLPQVRQCIAGADALLAGHAIDVAMEGMH